MSLQLIYNCLKLKKLVSRGTDSQLLLSGFQALVTLTLDRVIRHAVLHHSSSSIYISNCIEIWQTFFVDGLSARTHNTKTRM